MAGILRDIDIYRKADELMRICRSAVRKARAESRRLGVANVYSFNGERYFERPNGDFSRTPPKPRAKTVSDEELPPTTPESGA